jgi:hypothetical protein
MKKAMWIFIGGVLSLSCLSTSSFVAAQQATESTVTLYSSIKYKIPVKNCQNFKVAPGEVLKAPCDLRYGSLHINEDLDWLASSAEESSRSVIKDLGALSWTAEVNVPVVEPFSKLNPGEKRVVTIDLSGADGADGADGRDADGAARQRQTGAYPKSGRPDPPKRPKHDGKPKIDPIFVKAVVGHMYVIHVVDDSRDFYVLFRVEDVKSGDSVTFTWKEIPAPMPAETTAVR